MKLYGAKGFCTVCQKFDKLNDVSERNDTVPMFVNAHGAEARHCFDGEIEVFEYEETRVKHVQDEVLPVDLPPNRSRRRGKG